MRDPQADLDSNVVSTLALLEACRQHTPHARVVFTSTRQVYGKPLRVPLDETHPIQPVDVNAVHKLAAEQHLRLYSQVYGLSVCVLRLTNVIGPRMRIRDARQSFLGDWVRRMIQGEPLEVWGGEQERDLLGIDDCLDALLLAGCHTAAAGEIFNVGHERSLSLAQIAEQFIAINGSGKTIIRPFPAERSRIDIGSFATDSSRLRTRLGWNPRLDLSSTLQQTLEYHRMYWDHYV
jgi:UDP-glucose 4-epimerase